MKNLFEFTTDSTDHNDNNDSDTTTATKDVTAYQILRIIKSSGGFIYRNILDTLKVVGDVEHTRQRAQGKAQRLGKCMVVELSEKVVSVVD